LWKHLIRDENDFARHVDYIYWNPVKHGWVERVTEWSHSSFHAFVDAPFLQRIGVEEVTFLILRRLSDTIDATGWNWLTITAT
jgi:hypothetical protein